MFEAEPSYLDRKLFAVIADDPDAARAARDAVAGIGGEVSAVASFADSVERLIDQIGLHGILVETHGADPGALPSALAAIDGIARDRRVALVASMPADQIDIVWPCLIDGDAQMLCDPSVIERVAAIAPVSLDSRFRDTGREEEARLQMLNAEVARFAETIARLSQAGDARADARVSVREAGMRFAVEPVEREEAVQASEVRNLIRARRMRGSHFAADLFADPAWDMLLDLFAAELEHRRVSVSSLCIAAAVPGTTALRWIGTMVDAGLFERHADQHDRRRAYVGLSERARGSLLGYFGAVRRAGLSPA